MNDKNPDSASYLLDAEVKEDLRIALLIGSEQDFGMSCWRGDNLYNLDTSSDLENLVTQEKY